MRTESKTQEFLAVFQKTFTDMQPISEASDWGYPKPYKALDYRTGDIYEVIFPYETSADGQTVTRRKPKLLATFEEAQNQIKQIKKGNLTPMLGDSRGANL